MNRFEPTMYKKNIFEIDYTKLKKMNIKVLLFDFDNTIIEKGNYDIDKKTIQLFEKLKQDFKVYIVSNSINEKKLKLICNQLNITYIKDSRKPFKKGFKKLVLKDIKAKEIAMIGDQLLTDVYGASRMGYISILIDPVSKKELIITKINRVIEKLILKNKKFKRGSYYD